MNRLSGHRYGTLVWQVGELFQANFKRKKEFRKDPELFHAVEEVWLDTQFGKGRESFVVLLGQYGNRDVISTLLKLLKDSQLQGHAIYALRLLRSI